MRRPRSPPRFTTSAPPADLGAIPPPVTNEPTPTVELHCGRANVIFITGSTNLPPLLKAVQPLLYNGSPPYVAVFAPQTSCKGAASILDANATKHVVKNVANNYAFYYDSTGTQQYCLLDAAGNTVDVGESDVYPTSCLRTRSVANIADYLGPIQAITIVVPSASKQNAISAEAAHLVFGAGGDNGRGLAVVRCALLLHAQLGHRHDPDASRAITVDPTMVWGIDRLSAANLVASMEAIDPSVTESVIGLLSSDFADKSRANLRELAFQQQRPDSTATCPIRTCRHVRQGERPRRPLPDLGRGPPDRDDDERRAVPSGERADHAVHGAEARPRAGRGDHRIRVRAGVRDEGDPHDRARRSGRVPSDVRLRLLLRRAGRPPDAACPTCAGPSDCSGDTPNCNYGFCEKP